VAVDMHSHWMPRTLADALRRRRTVPILETGADGGDRLRITRGALRLASDHVDLAARLEIMDRHGIEIATLSIPGPGVDNLPVDDAVPLARIYNDGVAEACAAHDQRFVGFATLPCADVGEALAEFERAMELPGLIGALLPSNAFFTLAEAEAFRPVFAAAERLGALLFVHPSPVPEGRSTVPPETLDNALHRRTTLDNQAQISRSAVTLCLTGFLDNYPSIVVQLPNIGGNIALEIERMDHISLNRTPEAPPPSARLNRVHVDCNSFGPRGIELAVAAFGADRVVLGTDGTTFGTRWSLSALAETRLDEAERRAVREGNARRMLSARSVAPTR